MEHGGLANRGGYGGAFAGRGQFGPCGTRLEGPFAAPGEGRARAELASSCHTWSWAAPSEAILLGHFAVRIHSEVAALGRLVAGCWSGLEYALFE